MSKKFTILLLYFIFAGCTAQQERDVSCEQRCLERYANGYRVGYKTGYEASQKDIEQTLFVHESDETQTLSQNLSSGIECKIDSGVKNDPCEYHYQYSSQDGNSLTHKENSYNSSTSGVGSKSVHVRGYYRKDGTYVRPHYRSRPRRR